MSESTWSELEHLLMQKKKKKVAKQKSGVHVWHAQPGIREISSGAIVPSPIPGVYQIQANTMGGLCNFRAVDETDTDSQSDSVELELGSSSSEFVRELFKHWVTVKVSVQGGPGRSAELLAETRNTPQIRISGIAEPTTRSVLDHLTNQSASSDVKRKAVLAAEILSFQGEEREELCKLLHAYVVDYRGSNAAEDLIAVGSAIRKLVAYLSTDDIGRIETLLVSGDRVSIPVDVELEVAKTVVRKLSVRPPVTDDPEPQLGERLWEIVETYLNPRLLTREKYGATTLNAILALLLLRSPRTADVIDHLKGTTTTWFVQLVMRRCARITETLQHRVTPEQFPAVSRSMTELQETFRIEQS